MFRAFGAFAVILLCLVGGPAAAAGKPQSFGQIADAYFQAKTKAGVFSGAVIIAYGGRPLLRRAYGPADRERNIPVRIDDEFQIASTTKTFTAAAVGRLVAEGKLSFDDPISRYLPDTPAAWQGITVAHLLSHESGIPEYSATTTSFRALMRVQRTPQEIVALVDHLPLSFPPGGQYHYTNSEFVLLGLIIERVSGKPYEAYVHETLLAPLHLQHTGVTHAQALMPNRAHGYMKADDGGWENAFYIDPSMLYAAGSMYSTVDDLLAWDQALYAGKLLPGLLRGQGRGPCLRRPRRQPPRLRDRLPAVQGCAPDLHHPVQQLSRPGGEDDARAGGDLLQALRQEPWTPLHEVAFASVRTRFPSCPDKPSRAWKSVACA
jgi:CubicO group peptidase (beta-lactamase class C family)